MNSILRVWLPLLLQRPRDTVLETDSDPNSPMFGSGDLGKVINNLKEDLTDNANSLKEELH